MKKARRCCRRATCDPEGSGGAQRRIELLFGTAPLVAELACSPGPALDYWLFDQTAAVAAPARPGLTMRNQAGQVTFSSAADVMRIEGVVTNVGNSGSFDGSRLFAAATQGWAGHRIAGEVIDYSSGGGGDIGGGGPGDGGGTDYREQNDGKIYGTRFDGSTVYTEAVSWDDVLVSLGSSMTPPPDWRADLGAVLILDVTGLN